jgi:hypothetical protein
MYYQYEKEMQRILKQYKQAFMLHHFIKDWDRVKPTSVARQPRTQKQKSV